MDGPPTEGELPRSFHRGGGGRPEQPAATDRAGRGGRWPHASAHPGADEPLPRRPTGSKRWNGASACGSTRSASTWTHGPPPWPSDTSSPCRGPSAGSTTSAAAGVRARLTTARSAYRRALRVFPRWVLDYVIVHELAHLVEPGHGAAFKALERRYKQSERCHRLPHRQGDGRRRPGQCRRARRGPGAPATLPLFEF